MTSQHTLDEKKNKVSLDTDLLHLATHVVQDSTTVPNLLSGNIANVLSQPSSRNVSFSNEVRYHELDRSAYQSYSHEMHADDIDDGFKTNSEDDAASQLSLKLDTDYWDESIPLIPAHSDPRPWLSSIQCRPSIKVPNVHLQHHKQLP
ncbi:hypothetical protein SEMRO_1524_G279650.1 [Seminavis robusta]|uniref:Uncharacterized protein n=1 Tax=Seminavis robusta TaxID=568900 RepID=A0A9N8HR47_9STRA|nr:hypothetical protein SEMRO_1524_G279650.1 [Seminavis robusta]|eukprot:Sro1524_g279650.1 n/a (148) ;mRNA; r:18081-18524